ncbi:MAG: AmmeMemoRadiSam system protein B, partial [Phycisphaerae bacterium]
MKLREASRQKLSVGLIIVLYLLGILLVSCSKSGDLPPRSAAGSGAKESEFEEEELEAAENQKVVFTSALAQRGWYPADAGAMRSQITGFFEQADVTPKHDVIALILPHAGYRYSGQTAAYGVKTAAKRYKRIVVIGPSHYARMPGVLSVPEVTHYSTPLGLVPLDTQFIAKLKTNPMFRSIPQAHQNEHSVQIEVPLLQYGRPGFKLVPIVAGQCSLQQINSAAATLLSLVDNDTLVVASSDFVHYGSNYGYTPFKENIPEQTKKLDMGAFEHIANLDHKGFLEYKQKTAATICGFIPVAILLAMCPESTKAELLKYATSGEMTGDFSNSVSYLSVAFSGKWQEKIRTEEEQAEKL